MKVVTYFGQTDRTCGLTVKVRDAQPRNYRHLATVCGDTPQKNVYSLTNVVLYLLKVKSFEEPFFFSLNFTSVPLNETSEQLEIRYTSLTSASALPNLISLDLSDNLITTLTADQMNLLPNLKVLTLAELDAAIFSVFPELQVLNLSDCGVERLLGDGASHWEFYSHTGICIPLPITRNSFPGHTYSFNVFIVLNFVLFVAIAAGQVFVFWSIRSNSMSGSSTASKTKDLTIARRLITVAVSDFLCWFPICLLGLLAQSGTPIPGEVNVAMAIIALPLNSALNPFLYTVNIILERRRNNREEHLQKLFTSGTLES
nr:hypothetical protein BaRGS_025984 [Batillaria attramentaria]